MERVRSSKRDSAKLDLAKRKSVKPESTKRSRMGKTGFGVTGRVRRKVIWIVGELGFGEAGFGETGMGQTYFAEINMIRRNWQISESEFSNIRITKTMVLVGCRASRLRPHVARCGRRRDARHSANPSTVPSFAHRGPSKGHCSVLSGMVR